MRPARALATVLAAGMLLTGCGFGSSIRNHLDDAYSQQNAVGDSATYLAATPVGATAAAIAAAVRPSARQADGGSEFLRYDDDIVTVSAAPNGSTVHVEDLDDRYRSGYYRRLGPGFDPGSPAGGAVDGGPGDGK
ncbi:MAG: DUF4247 domain-containing protein [Pseudonocardia sp.]